MLCALGEWHHPPSIPLVDGVDSSADGQCRTFVTPDRLSQTFAFHETYDGRSMHPADIWPQGPNMLVQINDLTLLVTSSVELSIAQLKSMIEGHGIFVPARTTKQGLILFAITHVTYYVHLF